MRLLTFLVISGVLLEGSLVLSAEPIKAIEVLAELYNDCGTRTKRCFGDNDVCLQHKNCTFAISIAENRTTFKIITTNGCYEQNKDPSRDFFIGVGMNTVDSQGNKECREPTFDDFKGFILWNNNQKCHRRTYAFEVNVAYRNKEYWYNNCMYNKTLHGPFPSEGRFELSNYLSKHIIQGSTSGDKPPFKFADRVDYIVKDRIFHINRVQPTHEPPERPDMRGSEDASSQSQQQNSDNNGSGAFGISSPLLTMCSLMFLMPLLARQIL